MPRFYFNIRRAAEVVSDEEGLDLPDMAAVREEAVTTIRELIADKIRTFGKVDFLGLDVTDDGGRLVLSMPVLDTFEIEPDKPLGYPVSGHRA
jgi:hypothetical protein